MPPGSRRILDIGGGTGELARRLICLGLWVERVAPSAHLVARCRVNAQQAVVHEHRFEVFSTQTQFDLRLFADSYQDIPLEPSLFIGIWRAIDRLRLESSAELPIALWATGGAYRLVLSARRRASVRPLGARDSGLTPFAATLLGESCAGSMEACRIRFNFNENENQECIFWLFRSDG